MKKNLRKKKRGASILLLSFFFMTVLFLLAATLYKVVPAEMHAAERSSVDMKGSYVARAGIEECMGWLNFQMDTFDNTQDETKLPDYTTDGSTYPNIDTFLAAAHKSDFKEGGNWRYDIEIVPHQNTLSTTNNNEARFYSVSCTSFQNNKPIRKINVLLRQKTFALFGLFTDQVDPNSTMRIPSGNGGINGPVHTNDYWRFEVDSAAWTGRTEPYFKDTVGYARNWSGTPSYANGDGSEWVGGQSPYDTNGPITGRYESIFDGGRDGLRSKNEIQLPTSSLSVLNYVWPDSSTRPTTTGVYVPEKAGGIVDGGVYIQGDIDELQLKLDSSGNQENYIRQYRANDTKEQAVYGWRSYNPKRYYTQTYCTKYQTTTSSGGSGGSGGVSGGSLSGTKVCVAWGTRTRESKERYLIRTDTVTDWDEFRTTIVEVTEKDRAYTDENGDPQTAQVGDTLIIEGVKNDSDPFVVTSTKVLKGQINGAFYVDGNIGNENNHDTGLWGITKGSVQTDANGNLIRDASGNYQYNNKTVATDLNKSISLGGDLLQFNETKFDTLVRNGTLKPDSVTKWAQVALDPNANELSPNSYHAMGIWSKDVWMKGPKGSDYRNNYDGKNDVYAIILAGKTETDSSGNVIQVNGRDATSGGFGTWRQDRDQTSDGTGIFRIFGGIIQATTGANYKDSSKDTHYWLTQGIGYDVEEIQYDLEATKIPFFPPLSEFAIVRYLETSARQ